MKCPNPECRVSDLPDTHLFCFECGAKITHPDKQRNKQTASNVNQEQIDSTHAVESVTGNESSSTDENQLKRKSVEGEYELLEQNVKRIASDPEGCTAARNVTTCTGENEGTVLTQPVLPAHREMSVSNISSYGINVDNGENLLQSQQQTKGGSSGENEGNLSDSPDDDKFEESFEFLTADAATVDDGDSQTATPQCSNPNEAPLQPSGGPNTHTSEVVENGVEIFHETETAEEALKNLALGSPKADTTTNDIADKSSTSVGDTEEMKGKNLDKDVDQGSPADDVSPSKEKYRTASSKDLSSTQPKNVEVETNVKSLEGISKTKNLDAKLEGSSADMAPNEEKRGVKPKELAEELGHGQGAVVGDNSTQQEQSGNVSNFGVTGTSRQEDRPAGEEISNANKNSKDQDQEGTFYRKPQIDESQRGSGNKKKNKNKKKDASKEATVDNKPMATRQSVKTKLEEDTAPGKVNVRDVFKGDQRAKMTVVFRAILAPHFKYEQKNGDGVFMRFGGAPFYDFKINIVEMKPVEILSDDFILFEGALHAPVSILQRRLAYKYIVMKRSQTDVLYMWEILVNCGLYRNRCLKIPNNHCGSGRTWNQYDAAIFPEPTFKESIRNIVPLISKAMDRVHSRELATLAMLPRWEGFCTGSQEGLQMTAWEAVEQTRNVAYCMTSSESVEGYGYPRSDVPSGFNFGKVLFDYVKPRIKQNAMIEFVGRTRSDMAEKQNLRLASSIAITVLFVRQEFYPDVEEMKDLFQGLSLHFDLKTKSCPELDSLTSHFPRKSWTEIGEAIQRACKHVAKEMCDLHDWLLAVPLVHFLLQQSAPFESVMLMEKPRDDEWWGAQGLETKTVRNRAVTQTNSPFLMLQQIAPSFQLDPLYRRTFLLALPVKEYPKVTATMMFSPLEVFTTVAKILPENDRWSLEEWLAICTSINAQTSKVTKIIGLPGSEKRPQEVQLDENLKDEAFYTAEAALRVLTAILTRKKLERLETICECIKSISVLLSFLHACDGNIDEQDKTWKSSKSGKLLADLIDVLIRCLGKSLSASIPCYLLEFSDEEMQIWSRFLSIGWNSQEYGEFWSGKLLHSFRLRLEQRDVDDLVKLLSHLDMSKYHGNIAECVTAVTFSKVEKMLELGKEHEELFKSLSQSGIQSSQATKCGELLTMILMRCWPKPASGSELSNLGVLRHVLSWKLWPGYLDFFGKNSEYRGILSPDGQEKLLVATTALEAIGEEVKSGTIKTCFLRLLRENDKQFLQLYKLVAPEKDKKDLKGTLQKRCQELAAFEEEWEKISAFIKTCSIIRQVNIDHLNQKCNEDVSGTAIKDLAQEAKAAMFSKSAPTVLFFGLSPVVKSMVWLHYDIKNSQFFQMFWKEAGAKALKTVTERQPPEIQLTLQDVVDLVWNSAYPKLTSLRDQFINGQITLKDVDRYFKPFLGRYDDLTIEMKRMFPASAGGTKSREAKIKQRLDQLEQYHKLHRCINAARTILEFKNFVGLTGDFGVVEEIKNQTTEEFKTKPLNSVNEKFLRAGQALSQLSKQKIDCLDTVLRCKRLVDWLRETIPGGAQELKVLVDLAIISAGETDMETDRITCLHTSCLGFAPLIFDLKENFGFDELMERCEPVWSAVESDPNLPRKLMDTNRHMEWLKGVKESHGSVAMTSLMQAEAINARGIYRVGFLQDESSPNPENYEKMSLGSVIHLTLPPKDENTEGEEKVYNLDELKDLQSKLMLIAGKAAQGKAEEVERFVETLQGILRLATVYIHLCETGEVSHLKWRETFYCKPRLVSGASLVSTLREQSERMEECLRQWKEEIHAKRLQYSKLNHYTTQQLLLLRSHLARVQHTGAAGVERLSLAVYNLLESVLPGIDPTALRSSLVASGTWQDVVGHDLLRNYQNTATVSASRGLHQGTAPPGVATRSSGQVSASIQASNLLEQFQSLVDKVEEIGCSSSAEEVAMAAMVACGDVSEGDLLVWCFKNRKNDDLVSDLYSQATGNPKYAPLVGGETGEPMEQGRDESSGSLLTTSVGVQQDAEEARAMETDTMFDQTGGGAYLSLDELGSILTHLATLEFLVSVLYRLLCSIKDMIADLNWDLLENRRRLGRGDLCQVMDFQENFAGVKKPGRQFPRYLKRGKPNLLLVPRDDVLPTVLSLYIQDGHRPLPSPEEVIICTADTSAEEIELLWRRALGDRDRRLFCVVNADLVDYSVSQQAADVLNMLNQEPGAHQNEGYGLVVICSSENEDRAHIVAAMDQYRVTSAPHRPPTKEIREYLKRQFQLSTCPQHGDFYGRKLPWTPASQVDKERVSVRVVSSSRSGCGKSLVVRRLSQQLEAFPNNDIVSRHLRDLGTEEPLCVAVPIHGKTVDQSAVVEALIPHALLPSVPLSRIFHLDISPSVTNGLDSFLFNLLILGMLTDARGRVWRRRPCDLYVVEITDVMAVPATKLAGARPPPTAANRGGAGPSRISTSKQTQSVAFYQYFPTIKCAAPVQTLALMRSQWHEGTQGLNPLFDDGEFRTANVQRAFQYLKLWAASQSLDDFHFVLGQVMGDHSECLEMLIRHCGIRDPSWSELRHFVSFLNTQLRACEESSFCNMAFVGDTLEGFRTFVVQFMILMSRDFATPSLDETNVVYAGAGEDDEETEIQQFQLRRKWETSSHPYIFFNQDRITMTFLGFHIDQNGNLIDPERRCVIQAALMTKGLRTGLHVQRVDMDTNYESWSKSEKIEKLCAVMGVEWPYDPDTTYELTTDNMKKILAIHMRFRCGIPVVIMGETGCGKTRLIRYMCGLQSGPGGPRNMLLMKVHGGTTYEDIQKKVQQAEVMAATNQEFSIDTVLFFDEANTTEALGMIKEVMVDRRINGRPVGRGLMRLQFIAACNPYRRHTDDMIKKLESAGLGYHVKADETHDRLGCIPLRHLVYRVHALSASMRPLVWDFGQLTPKIEEMYTRQIVHRFVLQEKKIPGNDIMVNAITMVLAASQQYMRDQTDECSFVSLRDVERAMTVMVWFYEHRDVLSPLMDLGHRVVEDEESDEEETDSEEEEEDQDDLGEPIDPVTRALVLSLGVCYHARLQRRDCYRKAVASRFGNPLRLPGGHRRILDEVSRCQRAVLNELELGPNIARNTALSENVFMMVVCIELRIPLFVVGKPGSSKSLAKTVVADNMQGDATRSDLFKSFKQETTKLKFLKTATEGGQLIAFPREVHMASYQCSPLSTPEGIVATFRQCSKLQEGKNLDKFVSVVVLDEVGLAEDSPLMPLKSLHPLLEDGVTTDDVIDADERPSRVAFIGLSNWALDPAKMNRGIMLSRTVPDTEELYESALGICSTDLAVQGLVAPLLGALAKGYYQLYEEQRSLKTLQDSRKDEFFGLRDFYSLVKMVYSIAREKKQEPDWPELEHAIRRNFGGLDEINPVRFFKNRFLSNRRNEKRQDEEFSSISLIKASLERKNSEGESRYLLILTENYAALRIVQQQLLKEEDDAVVIFGSSFPKDQEYTQICRNINRIKVCMETGRTVILLNLESLYESLYDALNQYYVYFGGQKYVDLGLGSHRVKCRVSDEFRLIVIAEKDVVYSKFPIPLINRLEKHFLVTSTSLSHAQRGIVQRLNEWAKHFSENLAPAHQRTRKFTVGDAFVGFHDDTTSSVVLQVCTEMEHQTLGMVDDSAEAWEQQVFSRCQALLLECAAPDAVARLPSTRLAPTADALWDMYFRKQQHSSLAAYLGQLLRDKDEQNLTAHGQGGLLVQVTTHSRLLSGNDMVGVSMATKLPLHRQSLISLQQFHTEQQFSSRVREFFATLGGSEGLLIIQCDSGDQNTNLVACARHLLLEQRNLLMEEVREMEEMKDIAPIHIVVVVQLPRIAGGCSDFVGFQGGKWVSVHIDELRPPTGHIPPIEFLVDRSVSELFDVVAPLAAEEETMDIDDEECSGPIEEGSFAEIPVSEEQAGPRVLHDKIDVISLLRGCVQAAAGRIDDLPGSERRSTRRIELLLNLLPENSSQQDEFPFAVVLVRRIQLLLKERDERAGIKACEWLRSEALSGTGVQESGTFRKALWQRVYSAVIPVLSEVVAFADRDGNLELAGNDPSWTARFWLAILQSPSVAVMHYDAISSPVNNVIRERVPMMTSGRARHVFQCQYPFSWLIKERTDAIWRDANNISVQSNERLEVCLRRLLCNSDLGPLLEIIRAEEYEQASAERYLHDFVHIVYKPTADQEDQLVCRAVFTAAQELFAESGVEETGEEFVLDVSMVHVAHARIQERLNCFAQLVHAQPDIVARLLDTIPPDESEMVLDGVALKMCLARLAPTEEELDDPQRRLLWCNRVLAIRAPTENMLHGAPRHTHGQTQTGRYGNKTVAVLQSCRTMWQRVSAVRLFVEHVCPPGSLTHPADVRNIFLLWKAIGDDADFSSPDTMRVIERFLVRCSEAVSQRNNSYGVCSCSICLEALKEPVELPCQHICCLTCASQWFSKEQSCPLCRKTVPRDFRLETTTSLRQAVEEHTDFRRRCNSFFMELVSLFCFGESGQAVEPALFGILMSYVIHARAKTKDFSPFPEHGVDATPVVRSFLLQQLLRSSDTEVIVHLTRYLSEAQGLRPQLDHVLQVCLLFVQCKEDSLISTYSEASDLLEVTIKVAQQMCEEATEVLASNVLRPSHTIDVNKLEGVAKARYALTLAAGFMYKITVDPEGRLGDPQLKNELKTLFEDCRRMCLKTLSPVPRMYLLKQLARRFGIDAITVVSERRDLEWVLPAEAREKQAEDMVPDRFVVYGDRYRDIREAVAQAVLSSNTNQVVVVLEGVAMQPFIRDTLLLLALYREATMCNAFAAQQRQLTVKAQLALRNFIQNDQQMSTKTSTLAGQLLDNAQGSGFPRLMVSQGQSVQERTLAEIVIHTTAVLSCVGQNTLLEPFRQLMEDPAAMNGKYFPTMPDDNLEEAMTGMQGQTGKWYVCPRGHPYFIGDCGGAVEVRVCPECKVNIGGLNYNLQPGNVETRGGDRTSKGHVLGQPNTRPVAAIPERTMSPVVLSVVRLLMHSSMIMGACTDPAATSALIQPRVPQETVAEFLWQHLSRDLDVLSRAIGRSPDDAALTIHRILVEVTAVLTKQAAQGQVDLSSKNGRRDWEATFATTFINPVLKDLEGNVQRCIQLLVGDKRLGNDPLMRQLYEIDVPDEDLSKDVLPTCPVLWRYRAQVTVEHLAHTFQEVVASNDPSKCRVLAEFLHKEPKLRAVCYLPDIVKLQQFLMDRFHRRIDRTEAEKFKLKDFLKQLPETTKREFRKLIISFKTAWHLVRSYLDQAGRLRVPSDYCDMPFDSNSPMAMLLPTTSGIGICSMALVFYLCSMHNDFLHSYHNITGGDVKDVEHVALLDATSSHLIAYDHDRDLMPLILAQCNYSLEVGKGTIVEYNWAGLERQMIDRFIRGRPLIDYKDERFCFSKDTGADTVFASLRTKIHQVPLSPAIRSQIIVEFRSNLSDICDSLASLDIAISFLSSAGGRQDMLVSEYLHHVLRMRNEAGLRSGKAHQYCQLKHIVSLWRLLTLERARIMLKHRQDPFDNLPDVFKENMPNKQVLAFNKFWNETGRREVTTDSFISEVLQLIVLNLKQEAAGTEKMRISDYLLSKDLDPVPGLEDTTADVYLKHIVHAWQRVLQLNETFHETRASAMA